MDIVCLQETQLILNQNWNTEREGERGELRICLEARKKNDLIDVCRARNQ